jgi:hypothetical protein
MATFIRLVDYDSIEKKYNYFEKKIHYQINNQNIFTKITSYPIIYWITGKTINILAESSKLEEIADIRVGLQTGDNNKFTRLWFETSIIKIGFHIKEIKEAGESNYKWFPYNKGGTYKKWYGNQCHIVNWYNDGFEIKNFSDQSGYVKSRPQNTEFYFREGASWSKVATSGLVLRYFPYGFIFDVAGCTIFIKSNLLYYVLGLINTKLTCILIDSFSQTINYEVSHLKKFPLILLNNTDEINYINQKVKNCIEISKVEWDSRETSWDFGKNELIRYKEYSNKIQNAYQKYCEYWKNKFFELHKNEEELNEIFIDIYGLKNELSPEVQLEDITILKDETRVENDHLVFKKDVIIKQFISYAIGCILGRYSIDKDGLILANQGETMQDFLGKIPNPRFFPDEDNIVTVIDDEYFTDDLFTRFKEFLNVSFGKESLYENMDFIADALDKRSNETSEQTIRRYFLNDFFKDHCKMYNNRPIYWYFTSGKEKAFNALIYMHRYNKELLAKMRIDYLIKLEEKLIAQKTHLDINTTDSKKKQQALSKQAELNKKIEEIRLYDEKLKHLADQYIEIDLDDGVKNNYKLFGEITAKI